VKRYLQQRLKFRHLRVIDAIVTHESILQAAKALGLSQPALTKSLQEVEEIVGARLFDRHARGADPTPFGLTVAASARRLLWLRSVVWKTNSMRWRAATAARSWSAPCPSRRRASCPARWPA
jgi:hypothetical protein